MRSRTTAVLWMILGSFLVYCGQNAMTAMSHDG